MVCHIQYATYMLQYTTSRESAADQQWSIRTPTATEDPNTITGPDSCARQCGGTVGCVAFAFAENVWEYSPNCNLYTRVPSIPQYNPHMTSGFRKVSHCGCNLGVRQSQPYCSFWMHLGCATSRTHNLLRSLSSTTCGGAIVCLLRSGGRGVPVCSNGKESKLVGRM